MVTTIHMTQNGAGAKNGSNWDNAIAENQIGSYFYSDYHFYVKGNLTISANWSTSGDRIKVVGVKSDAGYPVTRSDIAFGSDRPQITMGGYYWNIDTQSEVSNMIFSGSNTTYLLQMDAYSTVYNCKFTNTSNNNMINFASDGWERVIGCEFHGTTNAGRFGVAGGEVDLRILGCFFDGVNGINAATDVCVSNCIFAGAPNYGIDIGSNARGYFTNNLFYNNAVGMSTGSYATIINNMFVSNTTAVSNSATQFISDGNNWYGNTADFSASDIGLCGFTASKGPNELALDPQFTDAANNNFTVGNSSVRALGFLSVNWDDMNLTGDFNHDIGATQAAGGGEGTVSVIRRPSLRGHF